jgi:hypothetical protein
MAIKRSIIRYFGEHANGKEQPLGHDESGADPRLEEPQLVDHSTNHRSQP